MKRTFFSLLFLIVFHLIALVPSSGSAQDTEHLWMTNTHLVGWYRSDLGPIIATKNNERVTLWLDQSRYGHHLMGQASINGSPERRPRFIQNAINGLPALHLQGYNGACLYGGFGPVNLRQFTVFVVYKEMTRIPNRGIMGWRNITLNDARDDGDFNSTNPAYPLTTEQGTNGLCFQQSSAEGIKYRAGITGKGLNNQRYAGNKFSLATYGFSTNLFLRRNAQLFGISPQAPTEGDLMIDYMQISSHTYPHNPGVPNDLYTNEGKADGNNQYAEIMIFDTTLSPEEFNAIESYLMTKYNFPYPGDLSLVSARRSLIDQTKITAAFSEPPQAASAINPLNFVLYSAVGPINVISVEATSDPRKFLVTTAIPIDDTTEYELQADDVLDAEGKAIVLGQNSRRVTIDRLDPVEISQSQNVTGYLDDFPFGRRNTNWIVRGKDVYQQQAGLLRVRSAKGDANHLSYEPLVPYDLANQEVLARIRVLAADEAAMKGGISVAIDSATSQGRNFGFSKLGHVQLNNDSSGATQIAFSWQRDAWYWLRLKLASGKVQGRIWKADGDTAEPETWHETTIPGTSSGFAGIHAGANEGLSEFEIDWILIKAAGLPNIPVIGPGSFTPVLSIHREGEELKLSWPRWVSGSLEQVMSLVDGVWGPPEGELSQSDSDYIFVPLSREGQKFYRLVY